MTGAEAIVEAMVRHGLKRIFIFPGGTIAPVLDAVKKRNIDIFCARHEQGAGYAALASAHLKGQPQVVMVTSGPGVTNIITTAADAYFDSTPLLVLTGQVGTGDLRGDLPIRQRGFQEVDATALLRPVTKAQFLPKTPAELAEVMESAFQIATAGRPGPVLIDLPMDVQRGEMERAVEIRDFPRESGPEEPDPQKIKEAVAWLSTAARPLLLAGQGVLLAGAQEELRALAAKAQIPVSQSLLGLGAFPTASPLALGFHGHMGNQYANRAIHESDLLLVVGSRLDVRQTGSRFNDFVPRGRVIRIDIDPGELEHARVKTDLRIRANAGQALALLNSLIAGQSLPDWSPWRAQIKEWRETYSLRYDLGGLLKPQYVIEVINRLTQDQSLIASSGVGLHQQWVARHLDFDFPHRVWLTSGGHGAMGFDLPAAVGAQLTYPDRLVLCFVGDGSFQINIQELATIMEHRLPIKIIVLDNNRLGAVSQFQKFNWGCDPGCGDKWNPDFAAIARAYGITSFTIQAQKDAEPVLSKALAASGPVLVHCLVDPAEDMIPILLAGQTMDKMWPYE